MPKKPTLADLEQQIVELTEALKRERADATNAARRSEEQLASARNYAKASVVKQLLPAIDNLERAVRHQPIKKHKDNCVNEESFDAFVKGVVAVAKQFEQILASLGVERIKTVGEEFDPELHEAISMEEGDGKKEIVSVELQSGYKLGDQVIRHAMVRVKMQ